MLPAGASPVEVSRTKQVVVSAEEGSSSAVGRGRRFFIRFKVGLL